MGAHVHSCRVPAYVEEVRKHFKEAYAEAHLQTNSEADQQNGTMTGQQVPCSSCQVT